MARYIGITIGPIFGTVNLTSSPAAMWAASYMFSSLSKEICHTLVSEFGVREEDIISPYYSESDSLLSKNDGVGLFHDRIFLHADGDLDMNAVAETALHRVAEDFGIDTDEDLAFLKEYLMVEHCQYESDNPIVEGNKILDSLELARPYVFRESVNPILALFENTATDCEGSGKNRAIRKIVSSFEGFALMRRDGKIKSIQDIVRGGKGYKKDHYYAIVRSDGDGVGRLIGSLKTDVQIRDFSRKCLEYCALVAQLVGEYGGVPIYAGGDDLLAILPCDSEAGSVFDFIACARQIFAKELGEYDPELKVSLSFGVTVAYHKFPLYEALEDSAELLFGKAKGVGGKNCVALRVTKHSGQSAGLVVSGDALDSWCELVNSVREQSEDLLLSAMHKLSLFSAAFSGARDGEQVKNLFLNTFDAESNKGNSFVHRTLTEWLCALREGRKIYAITDEGLNTDPVSTLYYMLRTLKFFVERGEGE